MIRSVIYDLVLHALPSPSSPLPAPWLQYTRLYRTIFPVNATQDHYSRIYFECLYIYILYYIIYDSHLLCESYSIYVTVREFQYRDIFNATLVNRQLYTVKTKKRDKCLLFLPPVHEQLNFKSTEYIRRGILFN